MNESSYLMLAIFVIYPDDPPEYFEQMDTMEKRVLSHGGRFSRALKEFTGWDKPARKYYEYRIECGSLTQLVDDL